MSARESLPCVVLCLALSACSQLTEPGPGPPAEQRSEPSAPATPAAPAPAPAPAPTPAPAAEPSIAAAHVLIAYKGALRAAPNIVRSKEEARKLANAVLNKAKAGADFGTLAAKYSDDPSAKQGNGSLGKFTRAQMVKPFADAAFALPPGGISGIVETPFGFHIVKRTE